MKGARLLLLALGLAGCYVPEQRPAIIELKTNNCTAGPRFRARAVALERYAMTGPFDEFADGATPQFLDLGAKLVFRRTSRLCLLVGPRVVVSASARDGQLAVRSVVYASANSEEIFSSALARLQRVRRTMGQAPAVGPRLFVAGAAFLVQQKEPPRIESGAPVPEKEPEPAPLRPERP